MSRRYPRRAAAAALARNLLIESEDEFSSDNEIDFLHIVQAVLQSSRRSTSKKRAPKKSKSPKNTTRAKSTRGGRRGQQTVATSSASTVTTAINLESDNEHIDEEVKVNQSKNIENKVDNFFKSGNLLSDEDDDFDIVKSDVKQPPKESKAFYSLSDSDDDKPSTSKLNTDSSEGPAVIEKIDLAEQSKTKGDDELMEIVDKILLDGTEAPIEIDVEPDKSWAEYKSKTEEILGSMNAILDEFKENVEEKKPEEKVEEKSPTKAKPTCPICLEILGSEVVAAATLCGHIFCLGCIQKVAKTSKTCPTCRKRINLKQIHPLYL